MSTATWDQAKLVEFFVPMDVDIPNFWAWHFERSGVFVDRINVQNIDDD
jgi:hypothetical protein